MTHRITDEQAVAAVELAKDDPDALAKVLAEIDCDDETHKAWLTRPQALAEAARWYCSQAIPCFPLVPGAKVPRTPNGFKDASTDPAMVTAWWQRWPDANIGLPTGITFDVIDVDGPAGYRSLLQMRDDGLIPQIRGKVLTPRGGCHLYIDPTGDGNTAGLKPGIDYRGAGGYVVAPPSRSPVGMWTWAEPLR